MMPGRLTTLAVAAVLVALPAMAAGIAPAAAQSVDDVIAKNIEARGGMEKFKSIKSARLAGRMTMGPGMEAPFVWKWKGPNRFRMEFTVQGMTGIQAYDGNGGGWMVMPFTGKTDAEPMSEEDLKNVDDQADLLGPLVDYKQKGHQVELVGKESIEGTEAWKLKVTKKNGDQIFIYLDGEAYLEIKEEGKRMIRGQEMEYESSYGDYKDVGGVMFAHSLALTPKGAPASQTITFETIELNLDFADDEFKMPAAAPAGEKPGPDGGK